jgi:uncharacterized protein (TIGR03545 family)
VLLALLIAAWWLYLDRLVEHAVEETGAAIVGARVDVARADVRLREGAVVLHGLEVTNPDAPMTNLVEVREVVANVRVAPLLEKQVVVETLAVRGVRFGTPRRTSGELRDRAPESGRVWREVNGWASQLRIPSFSLEGLGGVVDVDAIRPESLRTLAQAQATVARADSLRRGWEERLRALDPRPQIDSARALIERIQRADPLRLGVSGVTQLVASGRSTVTALGGLRDRVAELEGAVRGGVEGLAADVGRFDDMASADLAYARSLLRLPSLDTPTVSPALFGQTAIAWLKPVLYWVHVAEEYLPPGLDPKRHTGPRRARASGTTVAFPGRAAFPRFLLEYGETDLELGGRGAAAGRYAALIRGLSSAPALTREPLTIAVARTEAVQGPRELRLGAELRHGERPIRDSVALLVRGITLPAIDLSAIGGRLLLGEGASQFSLARAGDDLSAHLRWVSDAVRWARADTAVAAAAAQIGSGAWARDLLWRTLSGLERVEIDMRLRGSLRRPALSVSTNVAQAVAQSLRRELGREIERAEQQVRAEVDRLIQPRVAEARARVEAVRDQVQAVVAAQRAEVDEVRETLERELRTLTRIPGIRIP